MQVMLVHNLGSQAMNPVITLLPRMRATVHGSGNRVQTRLLHIDFVNSDISATTLTAYSKCLI